MNIKIHNLSVSVSINKKEIHNKIPILFLHGFTGSKADWEFLSDKLPDNFTPVLVDLLGHGKTSSPDNPDFYKPDYQINFLNDLIDLLKLSRPIIAGYSMGGRIAISYALQYPEKVSALILESTSYGIEKGEDRRRRLAEDMKIAEKLLNNELTDFIDFWISIPIFSTLKKISTERINALKLRRIKSNNKLGLYNSLTSFSTGRMKYLFPQLESFTNPVLLLAGEYDKKYVDLADKASKQFQNSELEIVKNCGHNVHFEKPEEFLKLLNKFLLNIREKE